MIRKVTLRLIRGRLFLIIGLIALTDAWITRVPFKDWLIWPCIIAVVLITLVLWLDRRSVGEAEHTGGEHD